MADHLFEITQAAEGFLRDRGSKFYAFARPVADAEAVDAFLAEMRRQYHDARHHCLAYRLGVRGETTFSTDDGEPSNSAGAPILAAIRSTETTNVAVIVVRYFGGVKLGVRGLIDAYRSSAEEALQKAEKQPLIPTVVFELQFAYDQTSLVNQVLHPHPVTETEAAYTADCRVRYAIAEDAWAQLEAELARARLTVRVIEAPSEA